MNALLVLLPGALRRFRRPDSPAPAASRRRYLWLGLVLGLGLFPPPAPAQPMEGGARIGALAGAGSALAADVWGHANAASNAALQRHALALFVSEAYGLPELRLAAVRFSALTRFGTLALGMRTFGFEDYRDTRLGLGYARMLGSGTSPAPAFGLHVQLQRIAIAGYGSRNVPFLSAGFLVPLAAFLHIGGSARYLRLMRFSHGDLQPPTLSAGLAYHPTTFSTVVLDVFKDPRFPLSVRGGLEVAPVKAFMLRAGAATAPVRFAAGAGLLLGLLQADLAAEHHASLGWTPALALSLRW